jgi:hypothetical protein
MMATPVGCRDPLEGIIVATLSILGLRAKTLDFSPDDCFIASLPFWGRCRGARVSLA